MWPVDSPHHELVMLIVSILVNFFFSGGIVQTVTGMNLDSVYAPMMTTFVRYKTLDPPRLEILTSVSTVIADPKIWHTSPGAPFTNMV